MLKQIHPEMYASDADFLNQEPKLIIKISVNDTPFSFKPIGKEGSLKFRATELSIDSIVTHLCSGKTITCGTYFNDQRGTKDFLGQNLFLVDFDNTLTVNEVEGILADYGLTYNFGYYTFNHQDHAPRMRIAFVFKQTIADSSLVQYINKAFYKMFQKKSDPSCSDAARMWFGTNKDMFIGTDYTKALDVYEFLDIVNPIIFHYDNNQSRSLVTADCTYLNDNCVKMVNTINNKRNNHNSTNSNNSSSKKIKPIDNWSIDDLRQFEIFNAFSKGGIDDEEA